LGAGQLLYDDVERHVEAINPRRELAAGDVLTDGKLALVGENGLTLDVDFGVPASNMPTVAKLWPASWHNGAENKVSGT
jgi:hypothetical protein